MKGQAPGCDGGWQRCMQCKPSRKVVCHGQERLAVLGLSKKASRAIFDGLWKKNRTKWEKNKNNNPNIILRRNPGHIAAVQF